MFLKRLVLKGFKSFADRSALQLEPGITAVVGPNGSGKSNISDAVLWVLGERNARNLRGQAMEDVIFSGSSARKATGMAEVDLVLDNSDETLPVDFNEVVITRRMYRSGESEYLINNTPARRMDVLDILHDSGLGTGTHSIISQGSLDSILRSDPQERRALIEEAAGVLKHKQRKERSERKLQKMEIHLQRVRDVVGEVERQLAPLARKAKRARTYSEISGQLAHVKLSLAVDDLRKLQSRYEGMRDEKNALNEAAEQCRRSVNEAEILVEELQEKLHAETADGAQLAKKAQACSSAAERLDSAIMLVRDRRRASLERSGEAEISIEADRAKRESVFQELETARETYKRSNDALHAATEKAEALKAELGSIEDEARAIRETSDSLASQIAQMRSELDEARMNHAQTQEALTNRKAHMKVMESRTEELSLDFDRAKADATDLRSKADAASDTLDALEEQERSARALVAACIHAKDAAVQTLDEAKNASQALSAQIAALEELEQASEKNAGDSRAWVSENRDSLPGDIVAIISIMQPESGYESIVETLLGDDVMSLVIDDGESVGAVASMLEDSDLDGALHMLMREADDQHRSKNIESMRNAGSALAFAERDALIDHITYPPEAARAVESILGDVIMCADLSCALKAHREDAIGRRFATLDGHIVWPNGKVVLNARAAAGSQGVLERIRHLGELKGNLKSALETTEHAHVKVLEAEEALSEAQSDSLKLAEQIAQARGDAESVKRRFSEAREKQEHIEREYEGALKAMQEASGAISNAEPELARYKERIEELSQKLETASAEQKDASDKLTPLTQRAETLKGELSEAELEVAKMQERARYNERVAERHARELEALSDAEARNVELARVKKASAERLKGLLEVISMLAENAQIRASGLEGEASEAQSSSSGLHSRLSQARSDAQQRRTAFDDANEKLNSIKVELARMEMQVQSAVDSIVIDCGVPMETALLEPELENRMECEEEAYRLTRKIANLGTINPDAAEEYEELKERYDYLAGQLFDLESAAKSLVRIGKVIEERMKDDFANTFQAVNENFQEIFATLFPGGSASLALDAPDDIERTGVEVKAQPAGKRISKMSLMSGGEKSLTALALLFAVYRTRSTPFYILDEVEAALDDTNLRRLIAYIEHLRDETQLIMITHQRRTMEMADVLFGVSMQADGVTKVISQRLEHALKYAE